MQNFNSYAQLVTYNLFTLFFSIFAILYKIKNAIAKY